jgi:hypothetical protein
VGAFNRDGYQDIVTANRGDANLTILLGSKTGGFTQAAGSPLAYPGFSSPWFVAVGDFNQFGCDIPQLRCHAQ